MAWHYAFYRGQASWYTVTEYCQTIQKCRRDGKKWIGGSSPPYPMYETKMLEFARDSQRIFCVDDLGLRGSSDSVYEIVLELIDCRKRKPTIITSNRGPSELAEIYDERIVSRLMAGTLIEVTGPDRRLAQGIRIRA
jgi:hypothetical protein